MPTSRPPPFIVALTVVDVVVVVAVFVDRISNEGDFVVVQLVDDNAELSAACVESARWIFVHLETDWQKQWGAIYKTKYDDRVNDDTVK